MSNNDEKKIISFELSVDLYERLKKAAKEDDRSISSYIRKILNNSVDSTSTSF